MKHLLLILSLVLIAGCSTPKQVEQHSEHTTATDTMAVNEMLNGCLRTATERFDSIMRQRTAHLQSLITQTEQEREVTTETVTTTVDSLGRAVTTQQRTTERNISRQMQQQIDEMRTEMENEMHRALAQQDSQWQRRFDIYRAQTIERELDTAVTTPVITKTDNRPWYQRWCSNAAWTFFGIVLAIVFYYYYYVRRKD